MSDANPVARDQLRAFIERIERLEEEKKTIADDIKDVYGEAKGTGFDTKVLRKLISIRKQDRDERAEQEAILDMYMIALGMVDEPAGYDEPRKSAPVERQPAMALRSDGGLSILTKHEDIRTSDGSPSVSSSSTTREAEESVVSNNSRPAALAVSGGEPSIPSPDAGGEKMDAVQRTPGRSDETSAYCNAQSGQATNTIPQSDDGAIAAVNGKAGLANADGVEPSSSDRPADQPLKGGDHEVTGISMGERDIPTSNTGEGAACALAAKSSIRPLCRNPGETCGGYGRKHCRACEMAAAELEAAE